LSELFFTAKPFFILKIFITFKSKNCVYTGTEMSHTEYEVALWPLLCVEFQTELYSNEIKGTTLEIPFLKLKT
jgi:hypothetical protein